MFNRNPKVDLSWTHEPICGSGKLILEIHRIKRVEYYESGEIKSIEYYEHTPAEQEQEEAKEE
jgi:hypothetical protein